MLKKVCLIFLLFAFCEIGIAQNQFDLAKKYLDSRGEVYFQFEENDPVKIQKLSQIISLDKRKDSYWFAYANTNEFELFQKENYPFKVLIPPSLLSTKAIEMANNISEMENWDKYPTYSTYLSLMQSFAQNYPELCKIDTIGISVSGRLILAAKIGKNISQDSPNPEFFYSSSIHGDELTGFVLMLRLVDYLLKNNSTNPYIISLLENIRIYINPLMNPDGTYRISDNTVSGSTRYNSNNVDLNRNFPDPFGNMPDASIQNETQAIMNYFSKHHFVMSACLHGGAEVVNYPWDSYTTHQKSVADNDWWQMVSKAFADSCKAINSSRFSDVANSGVTAGGDWYVIENGRQDYANAYHHCREVTLEISSVKLPSSSDLNTHWNVLYKSLLQYVEQAVYGINGIVIDSITSGPLQAKVWINNHDKDSSHVYSSLPFGDYHRPVKAGTYSVTFSCPGYRSKTFSNVQVNDFDKIRLDVQLAPGKDDISISLVSKKERSCFVFPNPAKDHIKIISQERPISKIELLDMNANLLMTKDLAKGTHSYLLNLKEQFLSFGNYILIIRFSDGQILTKKIIRIE